MSRRAERMASSVDAATPSHIKGAQAFCGRLAAIDPMVPTKPTLASNANTAGIALELPNGGLIAARQNSVPTARRVTANRRIAPSTVEVAGAIAGKKPPTLATDVRRARVFPAGRFSTANGVQAPANGDA